MKNRIAFFIAAVISLSSFAQGKKLDRIIKKDYSIIEAHVTKISAKNIEFTFPNETLINSLETSKIVRIDFANGRIETFNVSENVSNNSEEVKSKKRIIKKNTIAILPIPFVNSETLASSSEMAKFAQNDIYNKLMEKSSNIFPLTLQDLRVTNSLLRKAGITYKNIDETFIEDLQDILGVDNIIAAKVSYTVTINKRTSDSRSTKVKIKENESKYSDFDVSTTNEDKSFNFNVYCDVYQNNTKIYSKTRTPFFNFEKSWMDSMYYLIKRCPIYNK